MDFVGSSWSNTNTDDYFGTGDHRDSLIITPPAGLQAGDICIAFAAMLAGASALGSSDSFAPHPKTAAGGTPAGLTSMGTGSYWGASSLQLVSCKGYVLGSTIPDVWQCFYRDPAVMLGIGMIGGVMAFRNFTWDAANIGMAQSGSMVGPTSGDVTPAIDFISGTGYQDRIDIQVAWARWSTTSTDLPILTPPAEYTADDEVSFLTTGVANSGAPHKLYSFYTVRAEDEDWPADSMVLDQTDQVSIRAQFGGVSIFGTDVAEAAPRPVGGIELPRTRMDLRVFPNKLTQASLHELT